ncbi:hypothetical protein PybrP1_003811 [[Pythium] brassicae (nom. inval.)]|nr:hypothetical protein PybrP1_003811 [[Pythium] brassicae (nom. inval.)]
MVPMKTFHVPDDANDPGWRSRYRWTVWLNALQTLAILLRNALACVVFVWVAAFIFSHGAFVSGRSAARQTDFEFLAGTSVSTHLFFYGMVIGAHTPNLLPLEFTRLQQQRRRTTLLFCAQRLAWRTFPVYVLTLLLLVGFLLLARSAPQGFRELHPEFYASATCIHLYFASLSVALRRIFREETVIGQSGQRTRSPQKRASCWTPTRFFWKTWARSLPILGSVMLAGIYVGYASQYGVDGGWDFLGYTLGSLMLKAVIKEAAKRWTRRRKIRDPRQIFLIVGLPTVLIDTQVRIVLQRAQNSQFALAWVFGMAGFELVMRVSKVAWVKRQLRRWDSRLASAVMNDVHAGHAGGGAKIASVVEKRFGSLRDDTREIEGKVQEVAFQIAESYANMSAEYIAIGCSSCILYFYWDHPKYDLHHKVGASSAVGSDPQSPMWLQGSVLALQLAVEVVIDYVSCVVEIGEGIDFPEIRRYHVYLGLLFSCIACANIYVCSMVYMIVG